MATMLKSFSNPYLTHDDFSVPCVSYSRKQTNAFRMRYWILPSQLYDTDVFRFLYLLDSDSGVAKNHRLAAKTATMTQQSTSNTRKK